MVSSLLKLSEILVYLPLGNIPGIFVPFIQSQLYEFFKNVIS
jgi:hypothetical protein